MGRINDKMTIVGPHNHSLCNTLKPERFGGKDEKLSLAFRVSRGRVAYKAQKKENQITKEVVKEGDFSKMIIKSDLVRTYTNLTIS